jgi:hypothetical protein
MEKDDDNTKKSSGSLDYTQACKRLKKFLFAVADWIPHLRFYVSLIRGWIYREGGKMVSDRIEGQRVLVHGTGQQNVTRPPVG